MKFVLSLSVFLFALLTSSNESFSLTDFQIKKICKKEKKEFSCIKKFKEKRTNLEKGNLIEIPVIPYKR